MKQRRAEIMFTLSERQLSRLVNGHRVVERIGEDASFFFTPSQHGIEVKMLLYTNGVSASSVPLTRPCGRDPFAPPRTPVPCRCLHCGQRFTSDQMIRKGPDRLWSCPTPDCDGAGFEIDIRPDREGEQE